MTKTWKQSISLLLVVVMICSLFAGSLSAYAVDETAEQAQVETAAEQPQADASDAEEPAEETTPAEEPDPAEQTEEPAAETTAPTEEPVSGVDFSGYAKGVTVEKDDASPTGYTATFIYEQQKSYTGPDGEDLGDVARVEFISDGMLLFRYDDESGQSYHKTLDRDRNVKPEDFDPSLGLYPAGGDDGKSGKILYTQDMVLFDEENGLWGCQVPLPSGAYAYNYRVYNAAGETACWLYEELTSHNANGAGHYWLPDPNNMPMQNTVTGAYSRSSVVYVPYDAKQGTDPEVYGGKYYDRSIQNPIADRSKAGTVETVAYDTEAYTNSTATYEWTKRGIAVYLPNGYDPNRETPYNVLYISHGAQTELQGDELRWMNEMAAPNIMDNLIAQGKVEPFVIVSVDNKIYFNDWTRLWAETEKIMAYVESHYNVSREAPGKAYAGLSMGGITTSWILANHPDVFGYYGVWSGALANFLTDEALENVAAANPQVQIGYGDWDYLMGLVDAYGAKLETVGVTSDKLVVPGSHDWHTWSLMLADAAENFFFRSEYEGYEPGVTVEADADSPTGYTATFIFEEQESYNGNPMGKAASVQLYSDCMMLFGYDEVPEGTSINGGSEFAHQPDEFVPGLYPAGGSGATTYRENMTYLGNGLWGAKVPLTSGATVYNFTITDVNGKSLSRQDDPNNPKLWNTATGIGSLSSMVYVPYNARTMGSVAYADRSVENPAAEADRGTVQTIAYTGAQGEQRGLAVYLPAGYDADRAEPYPVLYLSHGASGDRVGNELRWMSEGAVANIMDNLIAAGKAEEFVVVTMNNQDMNFNFNRVWAEQELIFQKIEADYNVSSDPEQRAFAGLSMGGLTTSRMLINHSDAFGYYGIWSYADVNALTDAVLERLQGEKNHILCAAGSWDYLLGPVQNFAGKLDGASIPYEIKTVPGGHDWETWQLLYAYAAETFFFKATAMDYEGYEPGVTVEADADSPTGYTATFIFKENADGTYKGTKVSQLDKVELYSDCMMLFKYDEVPEGTSINGGSPYAHNPQEFAPGLYPAGGSGATTYRTRMIPLGDGLWGAKIPLTSGATVYNFTVTDVDGKSVSRLDDPSNPTLKNSATGIASLSSMAYTPYDAEKMGTGAYADRSVENPLADEDARGVVETISYKGAAGDKRGLAVYLPAGYSVKDDPYPVLYLSHGASGDRVGNELRWMNEGAVANIMDNLIAQGLAEKFVVVTMNNQDLGWNYDRIWAEQELIFQKIENAYNVCDTAEGRAFAGLSMGGMTTSNMLINHSEAFSYFGIWSYANVGGLTDAVLERLQGEENHIFCAAGSWDYLLNPVRQFSDKLGAAGLLHSFLTVPGGHDWETWQLLFAYAAENFFFKDDLLSYDGYEPGVTVEKDASSPTGYTATFIYKEPADGLYNGNELGRIKSVQLYSDCMLLASLEDVPAGGTVREDTNMIQPEDYAPGYYPAGGNGNSTFRVDMERLGGGLWGARVPLSSGATVYNFTVTDESGKSVSRLDDPSNPTMWNTATNIHSLSSMVYVPYDKASQGSFQWSDRSVENPADESSQGKVDTLAYTGAAGDTRGIAVYTPAGYDADRAEPYPVLYLSHGASGDRVGNELRWMNEGAVANIMDNLIAAKKAVEFVVVTMNNQDLSWNYNKIWAEQELIMAKVEAEYNVCDTAEGRAFAGLSMGGITTSNMLYNHKDQFSYYGIWSAVNAAGMTEDFMQGLKDEPVHILFGAGTWDSAYRSINSVADKLAAAEIPAERYMVPAAHDWETWQMIYAYAAETFFFKDTAVDFVGYDKGVTVEADPDSPTGYTATFIYEEQPSYNGTKLSDIARVELYSDCMMLFSYDEVPEGTSINGGSPYAHNPQEFEPGLYPAGGSGATTYRTRMIPLGDGLWGAKVPLMSGATVYNFTVTDVDGASVSRLDDPNNPTMWNTATKIHSLSSMAYTPYDAEKMGTGAYADRSVENPAAESDQGRVETISYKGAAGDKRGLAVYLPAGYSVKDDPYPVLYLSHGASGDRVGNELRWMNEGAVANIMDNLIAQGLAEKFVVVTMNNQDLGWNYDKIWAEQELIFKRIESSYNVCDTAEGRAFAGLSMGGMTTSNMLINHSDAFSYFGIWSYANVGGLTDAVIERLKGETNYIMCAAGSWDYLLNPVSQFYGKLKDASIPASFLTVPGGHDWETWQLLFAYAAENFFFRGEEPAQWSFVDVPANAYYHDAVYWAVEKGITNGVDKDHFAPDKDATRAETVTMLYRAAGCPAIPEGTVNPFSDVKADAYYYDAVLWAVAEGITNGTSATTFSPDDTVTRAQVVTFLHRLNKTPAAKTESGFADVPANAYYRDAVNWAVEAGVTNGTGKTTFSPNANCLRCQIVTFLQRNFAE